MASVKISALPESSATTDVALAGVETGTTVKMSGSISSAQVVTALGFAPAPLASPGFTGVPTAPTPSTGDNTTKLATTAFVKAQGYVTALTAPVTSVAGKTGAVTLVVGDVSGAAPIASPTFTGVPAAPTPSPGDNSTRIATTAFITALGSQVGIQFQDEGTNIGSQGTESIVNFTGAGITASATGATITVNVPGASGTVSSVGLSLPAEFSVTGSPVTGSGTLTAAKATQSANTAWMGPTTGSAAAPTFRALVAADLPSGAIRSKVTALSIISGVVTVDMSLGDYFTLANSSDVTSWVFTNVPASGFGQTLIIRRVNDATTPHTVAFPTGVFTWAGGVPGMVSAALSAVDLIAATTFDQAATFEVTLGKAFS